MKFSVGFGESIQQSFPRKGQSFTLNGDGEFESKVLDVYSQNRESLEPPVCGLKDPRVQAVLAGLGKDGNPSVGAGWEAGQRVVFDGKQCWHSETIGGERSKNHQSLSAEIREDSIKLQMLTRVSAQTPEPGSLDYGTQTVTAYLDRATGELLPETRMSGNMQEAFEGAFFGGF